jgi:hypothetical protein
MSPKNIKTEEGVDFSNKLSIFKKLEENKEEMQTQNIQIEKMQKKIRELIGSELNANGNKLMGIANGVKNTNDNSKISNNQKNTQPKTGK